MVPSRSRGLLLLLTLVCVLPLSPASKEGELPLCAQFEHNSGVWAEAPVRAAAERPPPCCGADRHKWGGAEHGKFMFLDDVKHCGAVPMETDPEFAGDKGVSYSGRRDFLVHLGGYGCSCQHFGWQDRYKWVPDSCRLVEWNARRFCELLGARKILLVGDSTVSQAATVLMNYIHWGFWQAPSSGCQQQVLFANSDTLIGRNLGVDNRGGDWKTLVRHFDPDIVIVSSGPHINHPMPYRDADFQSVVAQVAHEHRTLFPNKTLIWKTQAPGGCTRNISQVIPDGEFFRSLPYPHFNWEQFERWDWLASRTFTGPNQHVLDLSPLYYRTDAHPGCQYYEGFRQDRTDSHPMQPMHSTSTTPPPPPAASCVAGFGDEQGHGCQDAHAEGEYHIRYREKRDCLHHCVPGPIGLLPQLLLHLLYVEGI